MSKWNEGESGNPKGREPDSISKIRWDLIDGYIAQGTKWAFKVMEGENEDVKTLKGKDRLDVQMKAFGHLVKLAPQRQQHSGPDGGPIETKEMNPHVAQITKEYEDKLRVEMLRPVTNTTSVPESGVTVSTKVPQ